MPPERSELHNELVGRALLWAAWCCPALLTVPKASSTVELIAGAAVTAGLAGVAAFLPKFLWKLSCAITLVALPYTLWWCGAAAVGGTGPGYDAAVAATQTHSGEALGALEFVLGLPAFLTVVLAHVSFLFLALRAAAQPAAVAHRSASARSVRIALLASLLPLSVFSLLAVGSAGPAPRRIPLFGAATLVSPLGSVVDIAAMKIRLLSWYHEQGYRRRKARTTTVLTEPQLAIFIIGESVRAGGYGPNQGQRGAASRQLADRVHAGLGAWLPTTCAASDGTHLAVPMLVTATTPENRQQAPSAPTVLGILKAAGFTTAWLANNEAGPDVRERGHDLYAGAFNVNPDNMDDAGLVNWKYDEEMIPLIKEFASKSNGPKGMILHFIGSHIPYQARYPSAFFPPEPSGLPNDQLVDLRYARSLEYGARTILQVADILDLTASPAFLVYASDHGENLPSDHNGLQIHLGPRTSVQDGTVSAFVLWNKAMADTGSPARALSRLVLAKHIAHVDVARLFLVLAGLMAGPVEPTADPTVWGRISIGDDYGVVRCTALRP